MLPDIVVCAIINVFLLSDLITGILQGWITCFAELGRIRFYTYVIEVFANFGNVVDERNQAHSPNAV